MADVVVLINLRCSKKDRCCNHRCWLDEAQGSLWTIQHQNMKVNFVGK